MTESENLTQESLLEQASDEWQAKKRALRERFSKDNPGLHFDRSMIRKSKESLQKEVKHLEESNHKLSNEFKILQEETGQIQENKQQISLKIDAYEKRFLRLRVKENSLINEIDFFETELSDLKQFYQDVCSGLDNNISSLERSVKHIGFMRGETSSLIDKMSMLENEVPDKNSEVKILDETVHTALNELKKLYAKMHNVEKKVKVNYYSNKRQLEGKSWELI